MNKVEIIAGTSIETAIAKAKAISSLLWMKDVCFNFNGVNVVVNQFSKSEEIQRDFQNALRLGTKTVGPLTDKEVPERIKKRLEKKEKEDQASLDKYEKELKDKEDSVRNKVDKVDLNFDEEKLSVWHKNNQDGYGARIIEFSIHWSKLISLYKKDFPVNEAVKMACSDADFDGITGFMHSASKNILLDCLKEDEETLNAIRNS